MGYGHSELRSRRERRRREVRRRRLVAAAVSLALVGALILVAGGGGGTRSVGHAAPAVGRAGRSPTSQPSTAPQQRAVDRVMRYTPYVVRGGARRRELALTFDDGPGPYTPRVLRTLRRLRAPATFFQVGQSIVTFRSGALAELRGGYPIGNHTQNHVFLRRFGAVDQRDQVLKASAAIQSYGAGAPRLFRPPYRSFNGTTLEVMHELHMLMILWSVDSKDYLQLPAPLIRKRVLYGARPGAIVLMHDGGGNRSHTIAALPSIVHGLRRRGYRLVTIPRLLLDDPPPIGAPLPPAPGSGG